MMTEFQQFDSLDEMFAAMAGAEEQANEQLHEQQIAMRDAFDEPTFWMRPAPQFDCVIFGRADSRAETTERSLGYVPAAGQATAEEIKEAKAEADDEVKGVIERRARGYMFGTAYSILEPSGELGDTHVAHAWPISEPAFRYARALNWQPEKANPGQQRRADEETHGASDLFTAIMALNQAVADGAGR